MNHNFKIRAVAIGLTFVSSLASPLTALAVDSQTQTDSSQRIMLRPRPAEEGAESGRVPSKSACERIEMASGKIKSMLEAHKGELMQKRQDITHNLIERKNQNVARLEDSRDGADAKRDANYSKLLEKATTDEQKVAVETFKKTMEAAVKTRRDKVDTALKKFRDGVAAAAKKRQDGMQAAVTKMQDAVKAATEKAKTDCAAGVESATVKSELQAALKSAKTQFEADRKALESVKSDLEALKKTRNEEIKAAIAEFKTTAEEARKTLKKAFGQ